MPPLPSESPALPAPEIPPFEIGLVMAGAVSAGAYTGGVLDFLFEALDAWYEAKAGESALPAGERRVPPHEVLFRVVSGASAGSMCAAMIAVAMQYRFPHVRAGSAEPARSDNPFYRCWVRDIDIRPLLETGDLARERAVLSLLDSDRLQVILDWLLNYSGPATSRPYLAAPLCFRFTVGNLRGVPYRLGFLGNTPAGFDTLMHGDYMGFLVGGPEGPAPSGLFQGHLPLRRPNSLTDQGWLALGASALASGAFPLALRGRALSRPQSDYAARLRPGSTGAQPIPPSWPPDARDPYRFLCVDGGVMNNEPFDLAHEVLAGAEGANPRDGAKAAKALLMVDPFADACALGPEGEGPALDTILPLVSAWKMQCRFKAADLALAWDESVYSRFLVAPSRGEGPQVTSHPLAAGGLGGFLGFFHESFRHHDYLLGRRNAQQFLKEHFTLPERNPLFRGWSPAMKAQHRCGPAADPHLPIIPLVGALAEGEALPPWPAGRLGREELKPAIKGRVEAVVGALKKDMGLGFWQRLFLSIGWWFSRGSLLDALADRINRSLDEQRL